MPSAPLGGEGTRTPASRQNSSPEAYLDGVPANAAPGRHSGRR